MNPSSLRALRRLSPSTHRHFFWILIATLCASLLEGLQVAAFFPVFHGLLNTGPAQGPGGPLGLLIKVAGRMPFADPLAGAVAFLLVVTLLRGLALLAKDSLVAWSSGTLQHELKTRIMRMYADSDYRFFQDEKQGKLIYQLTIATNRVGVLAQKMPLLLAEWLKVLAIGLLLFATVPAATAAIAVMAWAYHGFTHQLSKRVSFHTGQGRVVASAEQGSIANEFLNGIRQVMAFGTDRFWLDNFDRQSRIFRKLYIQDSVWLSIPRILLETASVFLLFGCLLAFRLFRPESLVQHLALIGMVALALLKMMPSLTHLGQLRMEIAGLAGDAEALQQLFGNAVQRPKGGQRPLPPLRQGISLERVRFSYPGREELFRDFSLTFPQGTVTAVVGPSGGGKSTLAYLLLGLLKPSAGNILLDGVDLWEFDLEAWRKRVGFVSQDLFIFHASVADNIAFGRTGYSPEQIRKAAQLAKADDFIQELSAGYDTLVGERGAKLSGGQQQRLAIARAVLHDPEVLIFDEATSFLDNESERSVQEAVETASENRTVILIAHRLSTVRSADRILVLDRGRIAEEGTHDDLMRGRGRYFQLVSSGERPAAGRVEALP